MSLDLAFYTCFYGANRKNSAFIIPEVPSLIYKCYYFTNNQTMIEKIKNTTWIGVYDDKPISTNLTESAMMAKHIKACPNEYDELKHYSYLCYLDNKLKKVNEVFVEDFIHKYFINN